MDEVIRALKANNMDAHLVQDTDSARELVMSMIKKDDVVGSGGSVTLDQCGIRDYLRENGFNFLDWFQGVAGDEKTEILRKTLTCDVFLTSSNAITENGELYNVDGRGNRVSALIYGPKKVIVVAGKNKIVKDIDAAIKRNREVAAPMNVKKLGKKTGCDKTGYCVDCRTPERICRHYVITSMQKDDRISVIIVDKELGF